MALVQRIGQKNQFETEDVGVEEIQVGMYGNHGQDAAGGGGQVAEFEGNVLFESTFEAVPARNAEFEGSIQFQSSFEIVVNTTVDAEFDGNILFQSTFEAVVPNSAEFEGNILFQSAFEVAVPVLAEFEGNILFQSAFEAQPKRNAQFEGNILFQSTFAAEQPAVSLTPNGALASQIINDSARINAAILDYDTANLPSGISESGRVAQGTTTYVNAISTREILTKTYAEVEVIDGHASVANQIVVQNDTVIGIDSNNDDANSILIDTRADVYVEGSLDTAYAPDYADGEFVGVAVDPATGEIWFRKEDGTWHGGGDPELGTSPTATFTDAGAGNYYFVSGTAFDGTGTGHVRWNFGQRDFHNTIPVGFSGLGDF